MDEDAARGRVKDVDAAGRGRVVDEAAALARGRGR